MQVYGYTKYLFSNIERLSMKLSKLGFSLISLLKVLLWLSTTLFVIVSLSSLVEMFQS